MGVEDLKQHSMHAEYYQLNAEAADLINSARRVVAVGTTVAAHWKRPLMPGAKSDPAAAGLTYSFTRAINFGLLTFC